MSFGDTAQPRDTRDDFCYRHPDRRSFVLCQRCGRTICGDCQTQGAVGVVCPECMKEQRASAPRPKHHFVAAATGGDAPVVTYSLIIACVAVYVLQIIPGSDVTNTLAWAGLFSYPQFFEPWRMITSMFAHSPSLFMIHLLLNMYMLWVVGRMLEPALGRARFAALYFFSGLGGSLGVMFLSNPTTPTIGASGAIFGLLGAFFIIQRRLGGNATQLLVLIVINLALGFLPGLHIAWQAHLGGLIVGGLVGLLLVETRPLARRRMQLGGLLGIGAVLVLLCFTHFVAPNVLLPL